MINYVSSVSQIYRYYAVFIQIIFCIPFVGKQGSSEEGQSASLESSSSVSSSSVASFPSSLAVAEMTSSDV